MKRIGTVATYLDARRLGLYFRWQGIATRLEKQSDGWAISVCSEDHAPWAEKKLEAFTLNPDDPRFPCPTNPEHIIGPLRPVDRQIIEMHRQGHPVGRIAANLNISERQVRRLLAWIDEHLRTFREPSA